MCSISSFNGTISLLYSSPVGLVGIRMSGSCSLYHSSFIGFKEFFQPYVKPEKLLSLHGEHSEAQSDLQTSV